MRLALLTMLTLYSLIIFADSNFSGFANYPITSHYESHFLNAKRKFIDQGFDSEMKPFFKEVGRVHRMDAEDIYDYMIDYFNKLEGDKRKLMNFARRAGHYRDSKQGLYVDIGHGEQYYFSPHPLADDTLKSVLTPEGWIFLHHLSDMFGAFICFIEEGTDLFDVAEPYWMSWSYQNDWMAGFRGIRGGSQCKHVFYYKENQDGFAFEPINMDKLRNDWNASLNKKRPYKVDKGEKGNPQSYPLEKYQPNSGLDKSSKDADKERGEVVPYVPTRQLEDKSGPAKGDKRDYPVTEYRSPYLLEGTTK